MADDPSGSGPKGRRVLMPPALREAAERARMSPAIVSGGHVFLTGVTGGDARGVMPRDPERQIRAVFEKVGLVLAEAGLDLHAVVEMTSYHVGLREHFDLFDGLRLHYLKEPFPAWTAVEVAGLRRPGAIVELRVIASLLAPGATTA